MLAPSTRISAVVLAVGVTLSLPAPALAATTPTISAPAFGLGFGDITIIGTARAGATVTLIEAAFIFRSDMAPAQDYGNAGHFVTATANSTGHYSMTRTLDSGFVFAVEADGLRSNTIEVGLRLAPELTVSSSGGDLTVGVAAGLAQPGMAVHIQRSGTGTAWTTVNTGHTDNSGNYSTTVAGQGAGTTAHIRAYLEQNAAAPTGYADAPDNVWSNWTDTVSLVIGGTGSQTRTAATTAPAAPGDVSTPTTPPVSTPAGPKAGAVTFSKIQYDSPGRDTGSNASRNGEWFHLTNRTSRTIDLKSWTVRDAAGHTYTFGSYGLRAAKTVYVHTGRGTNGKPDSAHRFWGGSSYIWNNGGDTATLRADTGKTIDSCRYTGGGKGYTAC